MLLKIGHKPDHGFDEPLGLLQDCHRRIEHFLLTLITIAGDASGRELGASQRAQFERAIEYFATAARVLPAKDIDAIGREMAARRQNTQPGLS